MKNHLARGPYLQEQKGRRIVVRLVKALQLSPDVKAHIILGLNFKFFFWGAALHGMWDLSSLTRDQICDPCIRRMES